MIRSSISFHFFPPMHLLENLRWHKWLAFFCHFSIGQFAFFCHFSIGQYCGGNESGLCRGLEVGESSGVWGLELLRLGVEGWQVRAKAEEIAGLQQEGSSEPFQGTTEATERILSRDLP